MSEETVAKMKTAAASCQLNQLKAALRIFSSGLEKKTPNMTVDEVHCEISQDINNNKDVSSTASSQVLYEPFTPATNIVQGKCPDEVMMQECSTVEEQVDETVCNANLCDPKKQEDFVDETVYDANFCDSKKQEDCIDEAVYNIKLCDSKKQEDCVDETEYDYLKDNSSELDLLCDKWYANTRYGGYMEEEYVEVDGNYYEASLIEDNGGKEMFIDFPYADESLTGARKTLYEWSYTFKTNDDRNEIYDKWMGDLEMWERNRLIWLDQVGRLDGFDCTNEDRTFLAKVDVGSACDTKSKEDCPESQAYNWDKWYKSERLQRHKQLFDMGLPNWYEDLLQEQNKEDIAELSFSVDNADKEQIPVIAPGIEDKAQKLFLTGKGGGPNMTYIPCDLTSVYEFTDRNLWRRYHNSFKRGKYND